MDFLFTSTETSTSSFTCVQIVWYCTNMEVQNVARAFVYITDEFARMYVIVYSRYIYFFPLSKVDKFLDKNRDGLRKDLVDLIASCREPVSSDFIL